MSDLNALEIERAIIFKRLKILKILAFLEGFIALFLAFVASKDLIIALVVGVFAGVFFYRFLSRKLLARQKDIESTLLRHFLTQNEAEFKGDLGVILQKLALPFANFKASNGFEFKDFYLCDIIFKNANGGTFVGILLVLKNDDLNLNSRQNGILNLASTSTKNSTPNDTLNSASIKNSSKSAENSAQTQNTTLNSKRNAPTLNSAKTQNASAKSLKFKANLSSIDENALFQRLTNADFSTDRLLIKDNFALIATLKNPFFIEKGLNLKQNLEKMSANLAKIQALCEF